MRKSTKRKYWGRSAIAGSLRSATNELTRAIQLSEAPPAETPLSESLHRVLKSIQQAIEYERLYKLERKRIRNKLEREKKAIEALILEVAGMPVTKEEKIIKKAKES